MTDAGGKSGRDRPPPTAGADQSKRKALIGTLVMAGILFFTWLLPILVGLIPLAGWRRQTRAVEGNSQPAEPGH